MIKLKLVVLFLVFHISATVFGQHDFRDVLSHKVIVNHDERTIVAYVKPVKNNHTKADKEYFWFKHDLIGSTQGGYNGKLLNGSYQEFYSNKQLKESGHMCEGLKQGIWKTWNRDGNLTEDYSWNSGVKTGVYHKYDSLGKAVEIGAYKNNRINGKQITLIDDSIRTVRYRNGQPVAPKIKNPGYIKRFFSRIKPKFL